MTMLTFADIERLIGHKTGQFRTVCPMCGPMRRKNRLRALKIWRNRPDFATFACGHCNGSGYVIRDGAAKLDRTVIERLKAEATNHNNTDEKTRTARALALWHEARPIDGTLAERYLTMRGVAAPAVVADGNVLRFHSACPFSPQTRHPCLVALLRNIVSNRPQAIQRTALTAAGGKIDRMTLGPKTGAAIKLTTDDDVTYGLTIGEGLETVLGGMLLDHRPAWSVLDAAGIAGFPVLSGIQTLTILVDHDDSGLNAAHECGDRWIDAGREVLGVFSPRETEDVNDLILRFDHAG